MSGSIHCQECNQQFDTDHTLQLHVKYMHGNKVFRVIPLSQAGSEVVGASLGGDEIFRLKDVSTNVKTFREEVAATLKTHAHFIELLEQGEYLKDQSVIKDFNATIVKQDVCQTAATIFNDE